MDTIHAILPSGKVLQGTEALRGLFGMVGLGWVVGLMESPILAKIVDLIYDFLSKNRIQLSGAMDALVAARRVNMAKAGVEVCGDVDGGCEVEWNEVSMDGEDQVSEV
jgi:predicted DCC family thiol-disulfide oxidoreductase YuxK